jgi:competence protein ComEC
MKQPLVAVALVYGAGVVLGHFVEAPILAAFVAALAGVVLALVFAAGRPWLLALGLFLLGWLNISTRTAALSPDDLRFILQQRAQLVSVRGTIAEAPSQRLSLHDGNESLHTLAVLKVSAVKLGGGQWESAFGEMMSRTSAALAPEFRQGQQVEVTGIAVQPEPPLAEGLFDYRRYLNLRGIYHELKVETSAEWKLAAPLQPPSISDRFRAWAQRTLAHGLPEQDQSLRLQWAMLLGWQTALTAEVSEPFMRSGTMHIFAISGLHIALIAGIFVALFRAATVPRFVTGLLVIPIIWFYTCATGWQASAIRSTVMMTVILLGWMLKRPVELLNSLAAAAFIILVWQPEQLFQASFQLSFFVVLSIALLSPWIDKFQTKIFRLDPFLPYDLRPHWQRIGLKLGKITWKAFVTSLAAFIGSIPLIAYYFHLFTPGSLAANLVVVPVSSLALMSGLGALITGDVIPFATEWFNHSGWFFMRLMIWFSETAANIPAAWCHVRAPGLLLFVFYYGFFGALSFGFFVKPVLRWIAIAGAFALASGWTLQRWQERSWHHMTVLPLHGGHAIFAQPSRGASEWLMDCGNRSAVEFTLKPFLQANGVNRLAHLLLTYGDVAQTGGAAQLNKLFPVKRALASPVVFRSSTYREIISELESRSMLQRSATNGFQHAPWTVLHPNAADRFPFAEDHAVVALGNFDGTRVLLTSDLGKAGQNAVFARHPELRADVVIAGLPSKAEPLANEWLQVLHPHTIVLADSDWPATRRASRQLIARLRRSGVEVITTSKAGAVTISMRGSVSRIHTAHDRDATN